MPLNAWLARGVVLVVCGFGASPAAAGGRGVASTDVPMSVNDEGFITVRATIGDAGPFRLLLDTGANGSSVSTALARRLGLRAVAKTSVETSAGSTDAIVVPLPAVTLGAVTASGLLASVIDDSTLRAIAPDLDGILGQDFLGDERYTLDYARRRLLWRPSVGDETGGVRLAMTRAEDRWLVDLPQPGYDRPIRLVPDSGASVLALFDRGMPLPLPIEWRGERAGLTGLAGSVATRAVLVPRLWVGSIVLRDRLALVVGRRSAADGVLPLSSFDRVTFDPASSVLVVVGGPGR